MPTKVIRKTFKNSDFDRIHSGLAGKVASILARPGVKRVRSLAGISPGAARRVAEAMASLIGKRKSKELAFHVFDWTDEAAFLVALALFPGRFTRREIVVGLSSALSHFPNHAAAAAKLWGSPVFDLFDVGVLDGDE